MQWADFQKHQGATLAADGIALHYGDLKGEYHAALGQAVLMERSHEGRLESRGRDRLNLVQRISTNDVLKMPLSTGRATIFTKPTGRILERVMIYNQDERALITTEPGRGESVRQYLQRQVFFNDDFQINDLAAQTRLFTLHGPAANRIVETLVGGSAQHTSDDQPEMRCLTASIAGVDVTAAERKSLSGGHWALMVAQEAAETVWESLLETGKEWGLRASGSLTYNVLRIRAGQPGVGRELSPDYIPLEAGLWDEVSFDKGCYTGQEIIARMESRSRLAKTMVKFQLSAMIEAPASLFHEGKQVGALTSSVTTPDDEFLGLGFVKVLLAIPGQKLAVGESDVSAEITELAGAQAPFHAPAT